MPQISSYLIEHEVISYDLTAQTDSPSILSQKKRGFIYFERATPCHIYLK